MSIIVRKRPAITIPKSEGRKRPPIGIPKSKRGLVRMEQAVFKTIVEMAYEMDLAEYLEKVVEIGRILNHQVDWYYNYIVYHPNRFYYPTKDEWETIYKVFPIKEERVSKKYKFTYLKSNRIKYQICIHEDRPNIKTRNSKKNV
jgi:hypothetical protein